jgi:hypothetical protein
MLFVNDPEAFYGSIRKGRYLVYSEPSDDAVAAPARPVDIDSGTPCLPQHRCLPTLTDQAARRRFAARSARAALFPPAVAWRPAAGWAGAAVGVLGVLACTAVAIYMRVAYPETADAVHAYFTVVLVAVLAACLALPLVAPQALTSSALARRAGLWLGLAGGAGLLFFSRTGGLEGGAMTFTLPVQLVTFVIGPVVVAAVARSLAAALQWILWGFVFSSVTMFPIYIVESIRRYHAGGGLYLDGDAPIGSTIGTNLADAVSWLLVVVPSLLVPIGILSAALVSAIVHAIKQARSRPRVASS